MKVLHITNNYPTKNLPIFGIFVKEQIDSLTEINVKNEVFFANGYEKGKIEYVKCIFRLRKVLKDNNFDIIHCHHALSALMYILTFKYKSHIKIVSFQNDPVNEHGLLLFNLIKNYFNGFIFKNHSTLLNNLEGKGYYLPNGVDTDFFSPVNKDEAKKELGLDINKKYLLFISSFTIRKQKRIDRFDQTVKLLKKQYPNENFEELKLVNVKRELMPLYFNAAHVHLLTSDFEGSPNSVKESLSCNTPVVSTNVGNVKEMLEGAENCFVDDSSDSSNLAKYVIKAIQTNANTRNLIFDKKLDKLSVAIQLKSIYQVLLNYHANNI